MHMNLGTEDKRRYPIKDIDEIFKDLGCFHTSLMLLVYKYAGKCGLKLTLINSWKN